MSSKPGGPTASVASPPTVSGLMRAGAQPVGPDDRLAAAAARMRRLRAGALAVLEDGQLLGLISERDILAAVADGLSTDMTPVGDYMKSVPVVVAPEAEARAVAAAMIELRAAHLPVVRDGEVVGVISSRDLLPGWGVPPELLGDEPL